MWTEIQQLQGADNMLRSHGLHRKTLLYLSIPKTLLGMLPCSAKPLFQLGDRVFSSSLHLSIHSHQYRECSCKAFIKTHRQQAPPSLILFASTPQTCSCPNHDRICSRVESSALQHPSPDRPHSSGPTVIRATYALALLIFMCTGIGLR